MKFWILAAMTLALAMIAGNAMAQFDVSVSANTNRMRHLKVSRNDLGPGARQIQMVFWIYPDFELDQPGVPGPGLDSISGPPLFEVARVAKKWDTKI
jgi:hypothetical protein